MAVAYSHPPNVYPASISPLVHRAKRLLAYHSRLFQLLENARLSPIMWPALMLLYSRTSASLSEIATALVMPETTALRWVRSMEEGGIAARRNSANSTYVLTSEGKGVVEAVLAKLD